MWRVPLTSNGLFLRCGKYCLAHQKLAVNKMKSGCQNATWYSCTRNHGIGVLKMTNQCRALAFWTPATHLDGLVHIPTVWWSISTWILCCWEKIANVCWYQLHYLFLWVPSSKSRHGYIYITYNIYIYIYYIIYYIYVYMYHYISVS